MVEIEYLPRLCVTVKNKCNNITIIIYHIILYEIYYNN